MWMMVVSRVQMHSSVLMARRGVVGRCMIAHERSLPRLAPDSLAPRAVNVWTTGHDALARPGHDRQEDSFCERDRGPRGADEPRGQTRAAAWHGDPGAGLRR